MNITIADKDFKAIDVSLISLQVASTERRRRL